MIYNNIPIFSLLMATYVQPKDVADFTFIIKVVYRNSIFSLMMDTCAQLKDVVDFTCVIKVVYRNSIFSLIMAAYVQPKHAAFSMCDKICVQTVLQLLFLVHTYLNTTGKSRLQKVLYKDLNNILSNRNFNKYYRHKQDRLRVPVGPKW